MSARLSAGAVYIVDDDPDVLSSLRFLFEAEGFQVKTFVDGADLLAAAPPDPADCLLIDYKLGPSNGLELVRRLRERKITTPVVLITVYEGLEKKAAAVGVHDIVLKPHLEESIVARVETAMRGAPGRV